jgi:DNA modification methylase
MFENISAHYSNISEKAHKSYLNKLEKCLNDNLDFHDVRSNYLSHNFHAFPAKFPPQLPKRFILGLTELDDIVLDPMMGSGTTILEAMFNNRHAIGFDIDPLALMITTVKTTSYNKKSLIDEFNKIVDYSNYLIGSNQSKLLDIYNTFDLETKKFIDYWFYKDTIKELLAISFCVSLIENEKIKIFFRVLFSSIIITKSGGVSLALDLAHTRPHKAKRIIDPYSEQLFSSGEIEFEQKSYLTKKLKNPINEFKKKFHQNIESILCEKNNYEPFLKLANSQNLPLSDNSVDLVVTSPPYANNAIDYMRTHKFSLLWFGFKIENLKNARKEYIGHDSILNVQIENVPPYPRKIISKIKKKNIKKFQSLHRYFSEMTRVLKEMHRVIKPNRSVILVVANSNICGVDSESHICLKEIGESIGFTVPYIGERTIDRDRRMLPASHKENSESNILNRMHKEYIIGFYKY